MQAGDSTSVMDILRWIVPLAVGGAITLKICLDRVFGRAKEESSDDPGSWWSDAGHDDHGGDSGAH